MTTTNEFRWVDRADLVLRAAAMVEDVWNECAYDVLGEKAMKRDDAVAIAFDLTSGRTTYEAGSDRRVSGAEWRSLTREERETVAQLAFPLRYKLWGR